MSLSTEENKMILSLVKQCNSESPEFWPLADDPEKLTDMQEALKTSIAEFIRVTEDLDVFARNHPLWIAFKAGRNL